MTLQPPSYIPGAPKGSGLSSVDGSKSPTPRPRVPDVGLGADGLAAQSILREGTEWGPAVAFSLSPPPPHKNHGCC